MSSTNNKVAKPKSAQMHPGPGFRIRRDIERPDPDVVTRRSRAFDTPGDLRPDEPALHDGPGHPHA